MITQGNTPKLNIVYKKMIKIFFFLYFMEASYHETNEIHKLLSQKKQGHALLGS